MAVLVPVAQCADIPDGYSAFIEIDETPIALFNVNGTIYALGDTCSHAQASLSEGDLDVNACTIECPLHGSAFDLKTGKPVTLPATDPVAIYPVIIDDETVFIDFENPMNPKAGVS